MKKTGLLTLFACLMLLTSAPKDCGQISENCLFCNETTCTECKKGFCRPDCKTKCTGKCGFDCHIDTCVCRSCADGFYKTDCSVKCSDTCYSQDGRTRLCDRYTGACKDGCETGYCSKENGCKTQCGNNCLNKSCTFECVCVGCRDGKYGSNCSQDCPSRCLKCDQEKGTCPECDQCKDTVCEYVNHSTNGCKNCSICDQLTGKCFENNTSLQPSDCTQRLSPYLDFVWISLLLILIGSVGIGIFSCCCRNNVDIPHFVRNRQPYIHTCKFVVIILYFCVLVINIVLVLIVRLS